MVAKKNILESCDQHILNQLIDGLRKKYKQMLEEVNWVIIDQEYIKNKWEVFFAVDFYHVFEYAYPPLQSLLANEKSTNESAYEELYTDDSDFSSFVQHRAALIFLFFCSKVGHPILLPPHVKELKNHMRKYLNTLIKPNFNQSVFEELRKRLFTQEDEFLIAKAGKVYEKDNNAILPKEISDPLIKLIFKKLPQFLFIVSGYSYRGLEIIEKLVEEKRFIVDSKIINEYYEEIKEVLDTSGSKSYEALKAIRRYRFGQNFSDAQLIDIVATLNKTFINEESKKVIYFLSDTNSIMKLFHPEMYELSIKEKEIIRNAQTNISVFGSSNSIHRTTNIFLEYMMAAEDHVDQNKMEDFIRSREETIEYLKERRGKLLYFNTLDTSFSEVLKKCTNECTSCLQSDKCKTIKKEILEWDKLYDERVSMSILDNRFDILKPLKSIIKDDKENIEQGIKTIVTFLSGNNPDFQNELEEKKERLEKSYFSAVNSLSKYMINFSSEIHEELVYGIKPMRRIPFRIIFKNSAILSILKEAEDYLKASKTNEDINKIREISKKILKLTEKTSIGIERHLLLAILNYNFNQLENVNLILSDYLKDEFLLNKEEFVLVQLLALHQNAINRKDPSLYKEALNLCKESTKKYPNDSRFLYMYGVIIGRGVQISLEQNELIFTSHRYFKRALDLIKGEDISDRLFKATIYNSIAYSFCLIQEQNYTHMERAREAISEMEKLIDQKDWDANFHDTKGFIYYNLSKYTDDLVSSKQFINIANNSLSKAKELAKKNKYLSYEKNEIAKHLKLLC